MALERAKIPRWHSHEGHTIIQEVMKGHTPWKAGLRDTQLEVVAEVLDQMSFLYIDATSSGKTVAFSIPILVLLHYNRNSGKFPAGYRTKEHPVGIVITPTKGLSYNLVCVCHYNKFFFQA
jgi:Lhr-like helicase